MNVYRAFITEETTEFTTINFNFKESLSLLCILNSTNKIIKKLLNAIINISKFVSQIVIK